MSGNDFFILNLAFILANVKRVHPYQRRRTSITVFGLQLRVIIETERLVGVVTARLVRLLVFQFDTGERHPYR